MSDVDPVGCAIAISAMCFSVMLLVFSAGIAGCIDSEAFKAEKTVIVVGNVEELKRTLEDARHE